MKCIVSSCKHDFHQASPGFSKHRFPRDKAARLLWMKAIELGNNRPLDSDTNFDTVLICSDHFTPECFRETANRKTLQKSSIPTVFGNVLVDIENLKTIYVPKPDVQIPDPPVRIMKSPKAANTRMQTILENALRYSRKERGKSPNSKFRLKHFPHVCRMCLMSNSSQVLMVSLATVDPAMGGESIGDFIDGIMTQKVTFDQSKQQLLPQTICMPCLDLLKFFARYYTKITTLYLFMNSLIEVKNQNYGPIVELFNSKSDHLGALIKDLDLCDLDKYSVDDLLGEFSTYDLVSFEGYDKEELKETPVKEITIEGNDNQSAVSVTEISDNVPKPPKKRRKRAPVKSKIPAKKLDEALQCDQCPFSSYNKRTFRNHHDIHQPEACVCKKQGCSEVFESRKEYRRHLKTAHKAYVCETCGFRCSSNRYLKNHLARHLQKFDHVCPYCKRGHNTKDDLRLHIRMMHLNVYSYQCDTCGMTFRKKCSRDEHQLGHSDVYGFPCSLCDKKFKKPQFLKCHVNLVHEMIRIPCPHCTEQFMTRYKLNNHIEKVHGIRMRFICDVCVHTFNSQEKLDNHRERHDKPHELECPTCLLLAASKEMLDNHLCITYRDDYVCCGRDLRYHTMYNKHMLIKHGIRMNARVKPVPGQLMGEMRAKRKRVEMCNKCEKIFPNRTLKKQHTENCMGAVEDVHLDGDDMDIEYTDYEKLEDE